MNHQRTNKTQTLMIAIALLAAGCVAAGEGDPKKVRARVQARPGGPVVDTEMAVHRVPTDLPSVTAAKAPLNDEDLVLGVVANGIAKAYPIRFLSLHEVVDDQVGDLPVAPTW